MKIAEIMSSGVCLAGPDDTIKSAAQKMKEFDIGFFRLVPMIA